MSESERRLIIIAWTMGEPLSVEMDGKWDDWEVRKALEEALDMYTEDSEDSEVDP